MAVQLLDEITWDGQALLVVAATENGHVICRVPRETIHALRIYLSGGRSSRSSPPF